MSTQLANLLLNSTVSVPSSMRVIGVHEGRSNMVRKSYLRVRTVRCCVLRAVCCVLCCALCARNVLRGLRHTYIGKHDAAGLALPVGLLADPNKYLRFAVEDVGEGRLEHISYKWSLGDRDGLHVAVHLHHPAWVCAKRAVVRVRWCVAAFVRQEKRGEVGGECVCVLVKEDGLGHLLGDLLVGHGLFRRGDFALAAHDLPEQRVVLSLRAQQQRHHTHA
jgi:hypothetical protein